MFFINLLFIKFIVINVQMGKVHKHGDKTFTLDPYHVPQYWIIFFLMRSIHVRRTTWCLYKFPCNTHSHVQQTYLVKGNVCHIWMLLALYHSCMASFVWIIYFIGVWVTWVWGINVAFLTFAFTMCSKTYVYSFQPCACNILQLLLWIFTLTNQFVNFEALSFPKETNISMP
jgi:hypothetical protein